MTQNQLQFQANTEARRANMARESENYRHNMADESETRRHNVTSEGNEAFKNSEQQRHNVATEGETSRANKAKEGLQAQEIGYNYTQLAETRRHNLTNEAQNLMNLAETQRTHQANEAIGRQNVLVSANNARTNAQNALTRRDELKETISHNTQQEMISGNEQLRKWVSGLGDFLGLSSLGQISRVGGIK